MSDYDPDAERAARDWLALADRGDAEGSYAAAASHFRRAVPADARRGRAVARLGLRHPLNGVRLPSGPRAAELQADVL